MTIFYYQRDTDPDTLENEKECTKYGLQLSHWIIIEEEQWKRMGHPDGCSEAFRNMPHDVKVFFNESQESILEFNGDENRAREILHHSGIYPAPERQKKGF